MKKLIVILLCIMLAVVSCTRTAQERKNILVITDLCEDHGPVKSLRSAIGKEMHSGDYIFRYVTWREQDPDSLQYFGCPQHILDSLVRMGCRADLVVLCGDNVAHGVAACHGPLADDVPVVFIGVQNPDYKGLLAGRPNFTGFVTHPDMAKNLELIRSYRQVTWVTTTLDSGYMDDFLRDLAVRQLSDTSKYNANIDLSDPYTFVKIDARDTARMTLIPLSGEDESRNWKDRENNVGFNYAFMLQSGKKSSTYLRMKDDRWSDEALDQGVGTFFTMTPQRFDLDMEGVLNTCVGGYFAPYPVMAKDLHTVMDAILKKGESPSDIPWGVHKSDYWLNWRHVRGSYRYASELPGVMHFVNLPWSERSRVNHQIHKFRYWLGSLVSLLLFLVIFFGLTRRRMRAREQLVREGAEARETAARIDSLITANNGFLFYVLNNGRVMFSEGVAERFGLDPDLRISEMYSYIDSENREEFIRQMEDRLAPMNEMTISITLPSLGGHHYAKVLFSHPSQKRSTRKVVGLLFLVDDMVRRQAEIDAAFRKEEESVLKSSFLASMGHEIRTPLNAIAGFSKLLVEMNDSLEEEEKSQYNEIITANTQQLLSLIDNVISTSEEQSKDFKLDLSEKDVDTLMEELYMTHSVIVPDRLKFIYSKGCESDRVRVNRSSLLQVVSNLMNNAVKFTESGSITLGWTEDEDHVVIFVEDTGCGISEDMISHVFEKYVKAGMSEGAGLGLPLCRRLVGLMGGEIKVKSEPGVGSRFEVIFPRLR